MPEKNIPSLIATLEKHYEQENRFYHNLDHILHCYEELDWVVSQNSFSEKTLKDIGTAIFAHDILYNMHQDQTDEELSAQWLLQYGQELSLDFQSSAELIRSTAYFSSSESTLDETTKLMHSIDFAILGKNAEQYTIYKNNIRKEYSVFSDQEYMEGRIKSLEKLLSKPIYQSPYFLKYENIAKTNLQNEIHDLMLMNKAKN